MSQTDTTALRQKAHAPPDVLVRLERDPAGRRLTADEEVELEALVQGGLRAEAAHAGEEFSSLGEAQDLKRQAQAGRRAAAQFELRNLDLVHRIARYYEHQGLELDDLIQEGWFGLRRAVEKYDHTRGLRFAVYAALWVRAAITQAIGDKARTIRLPIDVLDELQKIVRAREEMVAGAGPSAIDDIARFLNMAPSRVRLVLHLATDTVALPVGDRLIDLADATPDAGDLEQRVERAAVRHGLRSVLTRLPARERDVVVMRFGLDGEERNLDQVSRSLGVTPRHIDRIETQALDRLRQPSLADRLEQLR